jgi:hypothetical protein
MGAFGEPARWQVARTALLRGVPLGSALPPIADAVAVCFEMLSGNPHAGRKADDIRPGLRRHEHESHVRFYREDADAILILAVIHRNMRPDLQSGTAGQ